MKRIGVTCVLSLAAAATGIGCRGQLEGGGRGGESHAGTGGGMVDDTRPDTVSVVAPTSAPIVITELMYHPVFENADDENHEFVEIYNRSNAPVSLDDWKLASDGHGISFTFPPNTTIMPGHHRVIAKNRQMLALVRAYGLKQQDLLGDYAGELANGGATVTLQNATGDTVDAVKYDDQRPWPVSADALGVSEDWLPAAERPISKHQYRGRSLERISTDIASGTPANWEASALDGPTPGKPSSVAGAVVPMVEIVYASPMGGTGEIIRSNQSVVITARFSIVADFPSVTNVQVEYFVDDVTRTNIPTKIVPMTLGMDGAHQAVLPAQPDNAVVRYRIHAIRGATSGVAAPRATDPLQWFAYFVSPVVYLEPGVETKEPTYQLFIRPEDWTNLEAWITPGRETGMNGCELNPDWDTKVPATFVSDGKVYDVRVRYEGSRYNRSYGGAISSWKYPGPTISRPLDTRIGRFGNKLLALSWRIRFPRYDRYQGKRSGLLLNKMSQGCPGTVSYVESKLLEKAGIPSYQVDFGRLHINGGYYHYMGLLEDIDDTFLKRVYPDEPVVGDLFKNDGDDAGPRAPGNFTPIGLSMSCPKYTIQDRYHYSYPRETYDHRPYTELIKLITDLTAARAAGTQAIRDYFMKYWDWQSLLTIYVIRNWAGVWDDTFHNMFPFKRPSTGKWIPFQQDFEWDFGLGRTAFGPDLAPFDPNETLYIGWRSPDPKIAMQCELPYPAKVVHCNGLGFSALKDAFMGAFKTEFDDKMRELTRSPTGVLSSESVSKVIDEAVAKFSRDDWLADPSIKMCDVQRSNADLYIWARMRNATVARKLGPLHVDAGLPADTDFPIGNGGVAIDWTKCNGSHQPSVSADDFCSMYQKTCGFFDGDSGVPKFVNKAECLSSYRTAGSPGCLAGQLCFAVNSPVRNDDFCRRAAAASPPCVPRAAGVDAGVP